MLLRPPGPTVDESLETRISAALAEYATIEQVLRAHGTQEDDALQGLLEARLAQLKPLAETDTKKLPPDEAAKFHALKRKSEAVQTLHNMVWSRHRRLLRSLEADARAEERGEKQGSTPIEKIAEQGLVVFIVGWFYLSSEHATAFAGIGLPFRSDNAIASALFGGARALFPAFSIGWVLSGAGVIISMFSAILARRAIDVLSLNAPRWRRRAAASVAQVLLFMLGAAFAGWGGTLSGEHAGALRRIEVLARIPRGSTKCELMYLGDKVRICGCGKNGGLETVVKEAAQPCE